MEEILRTDVDFTPCPVADGDEFFANGIFVFNVTKMNEYIQENPDSITLEEVAVSDFPKDFSSINESHVDFADISKPVLLAEISPGRCSLIDGNHRMEKARRMGIDCVQAYKLNVAQHIRFLTTKSAYLAYIEYWNEKKSNVEKRWQGEWKTSPNNLIKATGYKLGGSCQPVCPRALSNR